MAITNFIPTIWSENLYKALDKKYIGVANSNRDYDGDIKGMGSMVKICGVGAVYIDDYTKNTDMSNPQTLNDTVVEFPIDRAKYFNFQIDDIDRAQSTPKLMEAAMNVAASALAREADKCVYQEYVNAYKTLSVYMPTGQALIDELLTARQMLIENGVNDPNDIIIEVSPAVASIILKAKGDILTNNSSLMESGYIGSIYGCKVYVTTNISYEYENEYTFHKCLVRTKRAIAFAEQLSEIDAYRPEKRFADAVKGLHLFGVKTIYPQELVCVSVELESEYD